MSKIDVIDAIEVWNLNFNAGNVVKNVVRHADSQTPIQDLKKAKWYIERMIIALQREMAEKTEKQKRAMENG